MGNYVTADVHNKKVFVSNFLVDGNVTLSLVSFDDGTRDANVKSHFWNERFPLNFVGIGGIWFLNSSVHCN
jgi:hypothetical protein